MQAAGGAAYESPATIFLVSLLCSRALHEGPKGNAKLPCSALLRRRE